jgi:hypothetical protein
MSGKIKMLAPGSHQGHLTQKFLFLISMCSSYLTPWEIQQAQVTLKAKRRKGSEDKS